MPSMVDTEALFSILVAARDSVTDHVTLGGKHDTGPWPLARGPPFLCPNRLLQEFSQLLYVRID